MSRLTDIISLFYVMQAEDTARLEAQLLEARKRAWLTALRNEARAFGCTQSPSQPSLGDLAELKAMSREDAASITATYNRDAAKAVEALYAENRRGNRYYYARRMEQWATERQAWKGPQIAVTTDTQAAEYARRRFREMNLDGTERYVFSGPAPTCRDCSRRFAAGIVGRDYIRRYPTPRHVACPHFWRVVNPPKLDCGDLWLG